MENVVDIMESRNSLVAKDNTIIQNSKFSLGLIENKAILYLISKIKPTDEKGKLYIFNCREFQALLNWNKDASYQNIKNMLQNLGDMSVWIDGEVKGQKKDILVRWFNIVHLDQRTGDVEISFHDDMLPYLLNLKKNLEQAGDFYTTYKLQNITLMKHRYSIKIYEILKSYQFNNKKWTFENGTGSKFDLQVKLADIVVDRSTRKGVPVIPTSWANWAIFKRDVLEPSIKEINKYTDIKVAYKGKKEDIYHKRTRAIRSIEFFMVGKTGLEQEETDNIIESEYTSCNSNKKIKKEVSVEEAFFAEHDRSVIRDKSRTKEKKVDVVNSKYKLLASCLQEECFTENQIELLYKTAIYDRVAGIVELDNWEIFAADIITHYNDIIKATPEETKTTSFKRLLNMVKNDYDNFVVVVQNGYRK